MQKVIDECNCLYTHFFHASSGAVASKQISQCLQTPKIDKLPLGKGKLSNQR